MQSQTPHPAEDAEDPVPGDAGPDRLPADPDRLPADRDRLPPELDRALAAFRRHLSAERGMSPHTVRAYLGDVGGLLAHAAEGGCADLAGLSIQVLRAWLGEQHRAGQARTTIARRAAAARAFTSFGHARGWMDSDPGRQLGTPKTGRHLPEVLNHEQIEMVLDARRPAGPVAPEPGTERASAEALDRPGGPAPPEADTDGASAEAVELRDTAIMELLYACGIRVSELCGLDLGDLDESRHTIRVLGKRSRERTVPVGIPAVRAVRAWLSGGRPDRKSVV